MVIKFLRMMAMIVIILLFFGFALHPPSVMWSPRKVIGAVITGLSVPLLLLAHWQLGASFSVKAKARALVRSILHQEGLTCVTSHFSMDELRKNQDPPEFAQ